MKPIFHLLLLVSFATSAVHSQTYQHKSEAEIVAMTPAQRVDEFGSEQAYHKYAFLDQQHDLISKYIVRDGLNALPRMMEIMDAYDPTTANGITDRKGERFDAMWMLLGTLDNRMRLRASSEGVQTIQALARAIERMHAAGYGQKGQQEWAQHGRVELAVMTLEAAKGTNIKDEAIKDTLWVKYRIKISNKELLAFSNFLIARDPNYPSWSEIDEIKDYSRVNNAGYPAQVSVMKNPERFYEAYLTFRKTGKLKTR